MYFQGFCMPKSSKIPPKYDFENEHLQKLQKAVFLMILDLVLGGKSIQKGAKSIAKMKLKKVEQKLKNDPKMQKVFSTRRDTRSPLIRSKAPKLGARPLPFNHALSPEGPPRIVYASRIPPRPTRGSILGC